MQQCCNICGAIPVVIGTSNFCPNCEQEKLDLAIANKYSANDQSLTVEWPRPIPVGERLPEEREAALWFLRQGDWYCGHRVGDGMSGEIVSEDGWKPLQFATHWLPLPPSP